MALLDRGLFVKEEKKEADWVERILRHLKFIPLGVEQ
jgi:hypothetical protein